MRLKVSTLITALDLIRHGAGGGILATAATNLIFSPSETGSFVAAAIGAALSIVLVKSMRLV